MSFEIAKGIVAAFISSTLAASSLAVFYFATNSSDVSFSDQGAADFLNFHIKSSSYRGKEQLREEDCARYFSDFNNDNQSLFKEWCLRNRFNNLTSTKSS